VGIREPDAIVEMIRSGVEGTARESGRLAIGAERDRRGGPGIVNTDTGVVIVTSYLSGWQDVPLRDMLQKTFGIGRGGR